MDTKLYVGNLSYNASEDDLRTLFSEVGSVTSVTVIKDRDSGRSKGFGFIEMGTQVEAEAATSRFNGFMYNGRELKVNIARPREDSDRRGGGRGGYNQKRRDDYY